MRTSRCATSSRSTDRGGVTAVEAIIAASVLAVAVTTIFGVLVSTETHVRGASARQRTVERSRRVADLLTRELRDANFTMPDFEPDAPFDDTSIEYRKVVGYDASTGAVLSPTRASGAFRRISLAGGTISMEMPGFTFTLAEGVSDLRFTYTPPNLLTIKVQVETMTDGQLEKTRETLEVVVALKNQLP
jgi:hypothetical protein